jgi:hypothetical protein
MTNNMAKDRNPGPMELNIKDIIMKERNMAKDSLFGLTKVLMKVILMTIILKELDYINGQMEEYYFYLKF